MTLDKERRCLLLSEHTSSANKMHLIAEYHRRGCFVESEWPGIRHRVKLCFEPDGAWVEAKDILSDVMSKLDQ
jgi:hypothetical protein